MTAAILLASYLLGSLPFAFLIARHFGGVDIRVAGSGNVGATNVMRTTRPALGILAALLDIAKGSCAVWLAGQLGAGSGLRAAAGLAALVGQLYPLWLRFHGGKGVAVTTGVFAVLSPFAAAGSAALFGIVVWTTKYVSLGSILAAIALPALVAGTSDETATTYAAAAASCLVLFRHRSNMKRILDRTESRLGTAR
jgi:glycerol-3-phosphate acyltransferase PlsY